MMSRPEFTWLGLQPYHFVWNQMRVLSSQLAQGKACEKILSCEHLPVFTTGKRGIDNRMMLPDIPFVQTDRGGETTFHGPGQLMLYPIIHLRSRELGIRDYVHLFEQSCIDLLAVSGLKASRKHGLPGVWIGDAKIAAIGLRVRNGVVYHGMGLNVDVSSQYFNLIHPCGSTFPITNIKAHLETAPRISSLAIEWNAHFMRLLDRYTQSFTAL